VCARPAGRGGTGCAWHRLAALRVSPDRSLHRKGRARASANMPM